MKKFFLVFLILLISVIFVSETVAYLSTKDGKIYDSYYVTLPQLMGEYYNIILEFTEENHAYDIYFRQSEDMYYTLKSLIDFKIIEKYLNDKGLFLDAVYVESETQRLYYSYMNNESYRNYILYSFQTEENFRAFANLLVYKNELITALRKSFSEHTENEVREFINSNFELIKQNYEQIRASHVLVATEEEANEIIEKYNEGISFSVLAKEYSLDKISGNIGGDLGLFKRGEMVSEFEAASFEATVGEITEPIETEYGFHVILVSYKGIFDTVDEVLKDKEIMEEITEILTGIKIEQWFTKYRENFDFIITHRPLKLEYEVKKSESLKRYEELEAYYRNIIKNEKDIPLLWNISYLNLSDTVLFSKNNDFRDMASINDILIQFSELATHVINEETYNKKITEINTSLKNIEDKNSEEAKKLETQLSNLNTLNSYKRNFEFESSEKFFSDYEKLKIQIEEINLFQKSILRKMLENDKNNMDIIYELTMRYPEDVDFKLDLLFARYTNIVVYLEETGRYADGKEILMEIREDLSIIKDNEIISKENIEKIEEIIYEIDSIYN